MSLAAGPLIFPSLYYPLAKRMPVRKPGWLGRRKFQKQEDEMLRFLVDRFGDVNWQMIAAHMGGRTARQCRERYRNYLSPKISNRPWTPEEEELLTQKVSELGQRWTVIAMFFEGRSDVNVKNHWAAMMSRQERVKRSEQARALEYQNSTRESFIVGWTDTDFVSDYDGIVEDHDPYLFGAS